MFCDFSLGNDILSQKHSHKKPVLLSLPELSSLLHSCFFWRSPTIQHCDFFFGAPSTYTSTVQSVSSSPSLPMHAPNLLSLPMQHPHTTRAYKHPILLPSTRIFSLCIFPTLLCFWQFIYTSRFLFFLTHSGFSNEMLEVFETEVLDFSILSHFIQWILSVSRYPTLTHLPLSRSLDTLLKI